MEIVKLLIEDEHTFSTQSDPSCWLASAFQILSCITFCHRKQIALKAAAGDTTLTSCKFCIFSPCIQSLDVKYEKKSHIKQYDLRWSFIRPLFITTLKAKMCTFQSKYFKRRQFHISTIEGVRQIIDSFLNFLYNFVCLTWFVRHSWNEYSLHGART